MARLATSDTGMDPKTFIETRTKRYMAQALEEFEEKIEKPLRDGASVESVLANIEGVKATFRKKLQTLGNDGIDLAPSDLQINGYEPVVRR